jgi:hypothetical protein
LWKNQEGCTTMCFFTLRVDIFWRSIDSHRLWSWLIKRSIRPYNSSRGVNPKI